MKRVSGTLFLTAIVLVASRVSDSAAQHVSQPGFFDVQRDRLPIDYAAFASDTSDMIRLELYYQIYNAVLKFHQVGETFEAEYEMSVVVHDDDENYVTSINQRNRARVANERLTKSWSNYRVRQENFELPQGKYKIEFTLSSGNDGMVLTRELELKLEDFIHHWPTLSDIELVQTTEARKKGTESFAKGDFAVVPSVTGDFGGNQDRPLVYYLEINRGSDLSEDVRLETLLRRKNGGMVYRDSSTVPLTNPIVRQVRQITLSELLPGDYELEITLRGHRNKKLDRQRKELTILWSTEALLKHDFETAVDQLAYIAPGAETEKLKEVETLEERRKEFDEFWRERDPTPGTPFNEVKAEFYQRVRIANQRFGVMRKEGWRTDRGRIYIQHGEPDQIDDYPIAASRRPYQEWHYYRQGRYRKFVFVDEFEDGDYRLQYPYDGLYLRPDF